MKAAFWLGLRQIWVLLARDRMRALVHAKTTICKSFLLHELLDALGLLGSFLFQHWNATLGPQDPFVDILRIWPPDLREVVRLIYLIDVLILQTKFLGVELPLNVFIQIWFRLLLFLLAFLVCICTWFDILRFYVRGVPARQEGRRRLRIRLHQDLPLLVVADVNMSLHTVLWQTALILVCVNATASPCLALDCRCSSTFFSPRDLATRGRLVLACGVRRVGSMHNRALLAPLYRQDWILVLEYHIVRRYGWCCRCVHSYWWFSICFYGAVVLQSNGF